MSTIPSSPEKPPYSASDLTALSHLYRGEMYRSKIWRTRLDTTTNWAVATTGIALSVSFASANSSPLPLILVGLLVVVFLGIESRRYRYFDIWRTRVRMMEVGLFGPILRGEGPKIDTGWNRVLSQDYERLRFHIGFWEAVGRRLRRNYAWIFLIQGLSYLAKIMIHPTPVRSLSDLWERAAVGWFSGQVVLAIGLIFHGGWIVTALLTLRRQRAAGRVVRSDAPGDPMRNFDIRV